MNNLHITNSTTHPVRLWSSAVG